MTHSNGQSGPGSDGELCWQAFRYIAGEMNDGEFDRFEQQLADDQSAREAVAQAVLLSETVARSGDSCVRVAATTESASSQRRLWSAIAATAALAFLAGVGVTRWAGSNSAATPPSALVAVEQTRGTSVPSRRTSPEETAERVLALWSDSERAVAQRGGEPDELSEFLVEQSERDAQEGGLSPVDADSGELDEAGEFSVPSWMLAAVSPDGSESEPAAEEN